MGKILDGFMKMFELDDAQVIAMIGSATLQIIEPDLVADRIKKDPPPENVRKEAKKLVDESAFAILAALMERYEGGDEL